MPTAEKAQAIEQARDWYGRSSGVVFADYRGLKVKELQALRHNLKAKGGEIHVIKNTLFRIAAGDDIGLMPDELHNGPTAIAFLYASEQEGAKAILDFAATHKALKVKGGFFGGRAFDAKEVEALAKLPPRDVLIAQVIGAIAAPLSQLVGTIEAIYAEPIRTVYAVADKAAEGSPLPEPAPEQAPEPSPAAEPAVDTPAAEAAPTAESAPETPEAAAE